MRRVWQTEQLSCTWLGQFDPGFLPALHDAFIDSRTGLGETEPLIKLQYVIPQRHIHVIEMVVGQVVEQFPIGRVSQRIFAALGRVTRVEIDVGRLQIAILDFAEGLAEAINRLVHALEIEVLGFGRRLLEVHGAERPYFGRNLEEDSEKMRARPRILVSRSPRLVIVGFRQTIEKTLPVEVWDFVLQLVSLDRSEEQT